MPAYPGTDAATRIELSGFLKSRRARISPPIVGLKNGNRRRTPGLRREEVADLAGVGLTWYTWLEQGRDIRVSPHVLGAIARALQLEASERAHLFRLAGHPPPVTERLAAAVSPRLQRILDAWDPFPAQIAGRRRDILAWNRASDAIYGWSRMPEHQRNTLCWAFLVPETRRVLFDWEHECALAVAAFRADAGRDLVEPDYQELITDLLRRSTDFAAIWAQQDVRGRQEGRKRLQHPELGRLDLEFTIFQVAEQPSLRLYLYTPGDSGTETKLRETVKSAATA
ncbi:MAG: helix-turn-helix domain-containing protein [Chloroflexi bacterium]|nr:MAG: helix-turn-helix domain-containing protein [Chloroflexota bacterium]